MKIVRLTAENVKKIRVVEITPSGAVVQITGRNGSGKSSVLDAIWWALAGTKHIQSVPIRKGATSARVTLDMGEIVVTRRFTEKDSTLTVENAEGARYRSPQRMLDDLIGALSFDPLAFSRMEPKAQFEELKRLVPLEIDVDQLDGLNRADFADRTEVNRQAKAARAQADGIVVPGDLPAEPIDAKALMDQIDRAAAVNAGIERRKLRLSFIAAAERLEKESADLTETMAARVKAKETAIAAAKMPVDGLAFGEGVILYGGIPFDQASSAEQLRVSTAIAMAGNPKLRVLRIKEGSLLDEDGLELIRAMAEGGDYQVWIEQVNTSGKVGIVMEDGSIVPPPAATAQPALALEA